MQGSQLGAAGFGREAFDRVSQLNLGWEANTQSKINKKKGWVFRSIARAEGFGVGEFPVCSDGLPIPYLCLPRNEGMDPYSNPYITKYTTFRFLFPFFHSQLNKGKLRIHST